MHTCSTSDPIVLLLLAVFCQAYLGAATNVAPGEITILLYNGSTTNEYIEYPIESAEQAVNNSAWNSSNPVVLYIHGINGTVDDESTTTVTDAYLKRGGHNFLALNYSQLARYNGFVYTALEAIVSNNAVVGDSLAELIDRFVAAGVPLSRFHFVGYSIGAHVAGRAARNVNGTFPRITALDPYIHGFYLNDNDDHLWKTDATIVDVIHTNGIVLGVGTSTGTVDFYPNSGYALQPGCSLTLLHLRRSLVCSSHSAYKYWSESVEDPSAFEAIACDSWTQFEAGECTGTTDYMGYGYSLNATGNFYLETNSESPYSMREKGIIYDGSKLNILSAEVLEWLGSLI
ncbi:phospholipase A1-like isoform X3 [Neodiprion pinetum]|uniref:phospholipase A1 n=1 Tax=Neodiprion lecontei TaxID=441921 RepID=A0ABM3FWQ8_NEOLC|nr:phospholipase A1-like isoform X3 [Neodiprion pinetum]XP_046592453.1 phospholipase A1 isoform X3 [Neodiprion lecontei]